MPKILVGLGSNKPQFTMEPNEMVYATVPCLNALGSVQCMSSLYHSAAWPDPSATPYVNAVVSIETSEPPQAVLAALLAIEAGFGRIRSTDPADRFAPRTLDLDLIDYDCLVMTTDNLTLPHPRIAQRAFVLRPLAEVAPGWVHPVTGLSVSAMVAAVDDTSCFVLSNAIAGLEYTRNCV